MGETYRPTPNLKTILFMFSFSVDVPCRAGATKWRALGLFPGAQAIRGPDWTWGDQDGKKLHTDFLLFTLTKCSCCFRRNFVLLKIIILCMSVMFYFKYCVCFAY